MENCCHICYNNDFILNLNNHDDYCKECLNKWINSLNLAIDIHLADLDEWILTGLNDTYDDKQTIRLRNPKTNLPFSENELEKIYNFLLF
jgi:hypothetical protein